MNTDFHDVRFPTDIGFGSSGGPERSTQIVTLGSGHEKRNQRWAHSRRRYDAGYGVKDLDALHTVIAFYEARRGPLHGFRFRDPMDWKSCQPLQAPYALDQSIGIGDGVTDRFSLTKHYGAGESAYTRSICKPVSSSVSVAVDGEPLTDGLEFAIDPVSGEIVFHDEHIPGTGSAITAGFEFDVPVRFASDQLTVNIAAFTAGDVPSIPLLEIIA